MIEIFREYLQQKGYRPSTVNGHVQNVSHFMNWCESSNTPSVESFSYNDLLSYVQYEQQREKDIATINLRLGSISRYFEFLKQQGVISRNPARTLRIKGKVKAVVEYPLQYKELEKLYNEFKAGYSIPDVSNGYTIPLVVRERMLLAHQRNVVILGLIIWQGLHSGEIGKLEINHINLNEGTIYIPSTSRSNSRELKLQNQQILTLHTYMHGGTRDKLKPAGDELIPGNTHNIVSLLAEQLKGIHPQIRNAAHIRASVILHWLKQYNKRQVQYMAGHRYITSTEGYQHQQLDTLTDALGKHHPFG
jgi:site-specific recombinase XerD